MMLSGYHITGQANAASMASDSLASRDYTLAAWEPEGWQQEKNIPT